MAPVPVYILGYEVISVLQSWMDNYSSSKDPIIKMQELGSAMVDAVVDYVENIILVYGALALAAATATTTVEAETAVAATGTFMGVSIGLESFFAALGKGYDQALEIGQTIIFMSLPMGLSVMVPMFVAGITFSVYVPLIPLMLFLFGSISWLISVLVLMAAAPIICFLMLWGNSSQENPLLSQEAEQFVKQIVGVFFRPTLMVIGLIVGIVLAYIGVELLNLAFGKIFDVVLQLPDDFNWSSVSSFVNKVVNHPEKYIIRMSAVLVVYTFTMVSVLNMCFSTIYSLYAEVMKVVNIGAPALGMEQAQLEAVKGGVTQFAEAVGGGMKESATAGKGLITKVGSGGLAAGIGKAAGEAKSGVSNMMSSSPSPGGGGGGGGGGGDAASAAGEAGESAEVAGEATEVVEVAGAAGA
jgi:defect-in-organelle-trafficking protein DotA